MTRPIQAFFSRRAVAANLAVARRLAPTSRIWAVLKADAYGHGLARTAASDSPALADADGIAILETETAARLRDLGWTKPILLLEGCFDPRDLVDAAALDVTIGVHNDDHLAMIEATSLARPVSAYLKMNSGMNRLGFLPARYRAAHERLRASGKVGTITMTTHFANSDRSDGIDEQVAAFARGTRD